MSKLLNPNKVTFEYGTAFLLDGDWNKITEFFPVVADDDPSTSFENLAEIDRAFPEYRELIVIDVGALHGSIYRKNYNQEGWIKWGTNIGYA